MSEPTEHRGDILQRYRAVDTVNVADVLDARGLHHQALSAAFTRVSGESFAGYAFTLQGTSGQLPRGRDEDGVVVVPVPHIEEVLDEAERLTRHEESVRASLAEGLSLAECVARHGKV